MISSRTSRTAVVTRLAPCFAFAAIAACGSSGSGTEPTLVTLTAVDQQVGAGAAAIPAAIAIGTLSLSTIGRVVRDQAAPNLAVAALALPPTTVDRTFNCPVTGTAHTAGGLTGTLPSSGTGSLTVSLTTTFAACAVNGDSKTLVMNADPGLAIAGNYAVVSRTPADPQTLTVKGRVTVSLANSTAAGIPCAVDLTVTTSGSAHTATIAGAFCGATMSKQYAWTP